MNSQNNETDKLDKTKHSTSKNNQHEQQIKAHQISLASGIPLSLIFFVLIVTGWFIENQLSQSEQYKVIVSIKPVVSNLDEVEAVSTEQKIISQNEKNLAAAVFQLIIDESTELSKVYQHPLLNELSNHEKHTVFLLLVKRLTKEGYFLIVEKGLAAYSLEQRITRQVQFSLAFSQAKLNQRSDAIKSYQALLSLDNSNQSAMINLGYLYLKENLFEKAEIHFKKNVSKVSGIKKAKVLSGLAEAQKGSGQLTESINSYKKSIEYRPSYPTTWRRLANVSVLAFVEHSVIIQRFEKAIALDKNNTDLYLEFSRYLIRKMDYKPAIDELKKARKLSRSRFDIRYLLIICYSFENKAINANKQLKLAEKTAKHSRDRLVLNALEQYLAKNYSSSIPLFKGLLKKNRDNSIEYYLIGLSYSAINKNKSAELYLKKINVQSFLFFASQNQIAANLLERKQYQQSLKLYQLIMQKVTDNAELYYKASFAAENIADFSLAMSYMELASQYGQRQSYQLRLVELLWASGSKNKAIVQLSHLVEQKPHYLKANYRLASYLYQEGQIEQSMDYFLLLASQKPDYGDIQYQLAKIYYDKNKLETSQKYLFEYLNDNIDAKNARLLNARVFCEMGQSDNCQEELQLVFLLDPNYLPAKKFAESLEKH